MKQKTILRRLQIYNTDDHFNCDETLKILCIIKGMFQNKVVKNTSAQASALHNFVVDIS